MQPDIELMIDRALNIGAPPVPLASIRMRAWRRSASEKESAVVPLVCCRLCNYAAYDVLHTRVKGRSGDVPRCGRYRAGPSGTACSDSI